MSFEYPVDDDVNISSLTPSLCLWDNSSKRYPSPPNYSAFTNIAIMTFSQLHVPRLKDLNAKQTAQGTVRHPEGSHKTSATWAAFSVCSWLTVHLF